MTASDFHRLAGSRSTQLPEEKREGLIRTFRTSFALLFFFRWSLMKKGWPRSQFGELDACVVSLPLMQGEVRRQGPSGSNGASV